MIPDLGFEILNFESPNHCLLIYLFNDDWHRLIFNDKNKVLYNKMKITRVNDRLLLLKIKKIDCKKVV